ncbi:MAG: hypothetical protein L6Q66_13465, partial [Bacteroidia bacterium]|nr:hypothetical protein [Bacteroidia bacterium]
MKQLFCIFTVIALTGCCQFKFDDNDFLLNENELSFFDAYKTGETIYFEDKWGDRDTIRIVSISPTNTDPSSVCGKGLFMNPRPENTKSIHIEHLPIDKWAGKTEEHFSNGEVKISVNYQNLFSITKFPVEKEVENQVAFKNFRSSLKINAIQKEA